MMIDGYVADQIIQGQLASEIKPILNTTHIPSEQALWQMGKSADEWLREHDADIDQDAYNRGYSDAYNKVPFDKEKKIRDKVIEEYQEVLSHNFMKMIGEHTIGEILDKSYEQMKGNKNE